ncbi:hypothetical protein SD909_004246 [Vibrio parahaemolyticus]|nr:hypothetical protein [Vibrio parahaemolyticus]
MSREEVYDFIGEIALALYTQKINISLSALNAILADKGEAYGNNRGLAAGVSAAYRHWQRKDPVVYHAIAFTFRDKHGNIPWE